MLPHPFAASQRAHQFAFQSAWMLIVDVFHNAALLEFGGAQPPAECAVFLPRPLLIDQHGKSFFKAEVACIGCFQLYAEGIGHAVQFHRLEFLQSGLIQHCDFLSGNGYSTGGLGGS
jgi:hypothetical protein